MHQLIVKYANVSELCPPDYSMRGSQGPFYGDTVYWTLRQDKTDEFWADFTNATGITPEQ
jgi:hypothetical protein